MAAYLKTRAIFVEFDLLPLPRSPTLNSPPLIVKLFFFPQASGKRAPDDFGFSLANGGSPTVPRTDLQQTKGSRVFRRLCSICGISFLRAAAIFSGGATNGRAPLMRFRRLYTPLLPAISVVSIGESPRVQLHSPPPASSRSCADHTTNAVQRAYPLPHVFSLSFSADPLGLGHQTSPVW